MERNGQETCDAMGESGGATSVVNLKDDVS